MWVNFAGCGNPGAETPWEPYTPESRRTTILDAGDVHMEEDWKGAAAVLIGFLIGLAVFLVKRKVGPEQGEKKTQEGTRRAKKRV